MPILLFEATEHGPAVEVHLPDGGALIDACDDARAPVPFSCRSANCGTCRVEILEGAELLEPPAEAERALLEILADASGERLACQARARPGPGLVRIRAAGLGAGAQDTTRSGRGGR